MCYTANNLTAKSFVAAVVCGLSLAASAAAQCTSGLVSVSQPFVFPNHAAGPLVWTGSVYGAIKVDAGNSANSLYFAFYDVNLTQVQADTLLVGATAATRRILLWNGSEFALFYQTPAQQLTYLRLDANGNPVGAPIAVAPQHGVAPGEEYDAAWDASRKTYVIFHAIKAGLDRGLWLTVIGLDGTQKSDETVSLFNADPTYPRVAVTPSGTIGIAWSRLVNNGQQELAFGVYVPGSGPLSVSSVRAGGSNPRLATDGRFFLLVYSSPVTGGTVLRDVKYDTAGRVATADTLLLSVAQDDAAFSLIPNPALGEWGSLYVSYPIGFANPSFGETRLLRIFFSGAPPTDAQLATDGTKRTLPPQSELTWNGTGYVAAIGRFLTGGDASESYYARYCPLLVTASANPAVAVTFSPITFTANPSGGTGPYKFSWSFGDISSPEPGQTVTHSYHDPGTYTATVTATDATGAATTSTVTVTIAKLRRHAAGRP